MDSRRSIYSCHGSGRGRCRVDLDAAGKTPIEVGAPLPVHSVEKVTFEKGALALAWLSAQFART